MQNMSFTGMPATYGTIVPAVPVAGFYLLTKMKNANATKMASYSQHHIAQY